MKVLCTFTSRLSHLNLFHNIKINLIHACCQQFTLPFKIKFFVISQKYCCFKHILFYSRSKLMSRSFWAFNLLVVKNQKEEWKSKLCYFLLFFHQGNGWSKLLKKCVWDLSYFIFGFSFLLGIVFFICLSLFLRYICDLWFVICDMGFSFDQ